jgi:hypothetical protein
MRFPVLDAAWLDNTQGLIGPEEGRRLAEIAATVPEDHAIVEIGSHTGLSSCWLALGSRLGNGAHVTCVDPYPPPRPESLDDPWDLGPEGVLERFKSNVAGTTQDVPRQSYWSSITMLRTTSEEAAALWVQPVGLLFVDAIHTEAGVLADWTAWSPHVVGVAAFHDFGDAYPGCRRGIERIASAEEWIDVRVTTTLWEGRRAS